ncbi:MAG: hypothetical protein IJM23_03070 [Lachnospiraceae bacterium]|nr:hypothetical protein [Lachnospiraceae bacterium]
MEDNIQNNETPKEGGKKNIKKILTIVGRIFTVLSIVFVGRAIYKLGFDFSVIHNWPLFLLVSVVCAFVFGAGMFVQGYAWKLWLSFFSARDIDTKGALCVYTKANIGKYLPGNVMHFVERNLFAERAGASQSAVAFSSVAEIITQVLAAFIIALVGAGGTIFEVLDALFPGGYIPVVAGVIAAGVIFCVIAYFVAMKLFGEKIRAILSKYSVSGLILTLLKSMVLYMVVMLIGGVIMVVLYVYMGGTPDLKTSCLIVSCYVIAWVIGFVVIGAPGGIGVREFVLTMTLGSAIGNELVVTLMVVHRLINIVGDFLAYLAQYLITGAEK